MISPLQSSLYRDGPFDFDENSFRFGSILSFSLPYELIPGLEATPSVASSPVPSNQRLPHSCVVCGVEITDSEEVPVKVTGYMIGTMNGGTLLNQIVAKSPTCPLPTPSGLVSIPTGDLFIPLHNPSSSGLQPPASDSRPATFLEPPLAPAFMPDVPCWLNIIQTTVSLSRNHDITQLLNSDGELVQVRMPALARIQSYIIHRGQGGGKDEVSPPIVAGSTGSDSDSESDWDEGDVDKPMDKEEMYWFFASLAQLPSDSNFYTVVFEAMHTQRAEEAKAASDAKVTEWLSHSAQVNEAYEYE